MKKKLSILISTILVLMLLSGCASGIRNASQTQGVSEIFGAEKGYNGSSLSDAITSTNKHEQSITENEDTSSKTINTSASDNDLNNRKLIKDVSIYIETLSFDEFINNLNNKITKYGGYIQSSEVDGNRYYKSSLRNARIIARIPADNLTDFKNETSEIGNVISSSESVKDITASYVDNESRIKALETEEATLLSLMEKAENLSDLLTVEERLTEVRADLESLKSTIRTYDNLISYSTVTIDVDEVERETVVEEQGYFDEIWEKLSANLENIGNGFKDFSIWFIVSLPYFLIIAAAVVIIVVVIKLSVKSRKKKKSKAVPVQNNQPPVNTYISNNTIQDSSESKNDENKSK